MNTKQPTFKKLVNIPPALLDYDKIEARISQVALKLTPETVTEKTREAMNCIFGGTYDIDSWIKNLTKNDIKEAIDALKDFNRNIVKPPSQRKISFWDGDGTFETLLGYLSAVLVLYGELDLAHQVNKLVLTTNSIGDDGIGDGDCYDADNIMTLISNFPVWAKKTLTSFDILRYKLRSSWGHLGFRDRPLYISHGILQLFSKYEMAYRNLEAKNKNLENKIKELDDKVIKLDDKVTDLTYRPGGPGFEKAQNKQVGIYGMKK